MKVTSGQYPSIEQIASQYLDNTGNNISNSKVNKSFADILSERQKAAGTFNEIKFSKHAAGRLTERNIKLSESQMDRLGAGMQAAGEKGINESLVMVDQLAFIVNVKNQTVITALDGTDSTQNVFTNIDGAVIA